MNGACNLTVMRFAIRVAATDDRCGRDVRGGNVTVLATGSVARTKPPPPRHMSWWTRRPHDDARVARQDEATHNTHARTRKRNHRRRRPPTKRALARKSGPK